MVKKIILILVLLVFALTLFSENTEHNLVQNTGEQDDEPKVIEIQIIRREKARDSQSIEGEKESKKHYYLFHKKGEKKDENGVITGTNKMKEFKTDAELIKKHGKSYEPDQNYVSISIKRGQKINWTCPFPFTIFYGGRSILTTDPLGWARPGQIISYLQGVKKGENWYQTPDAWIVNNALDGAYKYFVSVYIPEADIVYVDDPETIVRRPK